MSKILVLEPRAEEMDGIFEKIYDLVPEGWKYGRHIKQHSNSQKEFLWERDGHLYY